jgi:hypothetical protein
MAFIGRTKDVKVRQQRVIGNGLDKIFTLDFIPASDNQLSIYINGVFLSDYDYIFKHPDKIIFTDIPANGTEILIVCLKSSDKQSTRNTFYYADGVSRIYDIGFIPPEDGSILVSINGDLQNDEKYIVEGHKCIFMHTPSINSEIEFRGVYDVIDPSGNVQASNNLNIQRTRVKADGYQNIFPMHQKPAAEHNLIVTEGRNIKNDRQYALVNEYKYVQENVPGQYEEMEFRGLVGSTYTNLNRRCMIGEDRDGIPTGLSVQSAGSSGYTTATNLEARGGSGEGLRVDITASGGVVTGVSVNTDLAGGDFAYNYNTSEDLTIIQAGSSNNATCRITSVRNSDGQRYWDINNHIWDFQDDTFRKETTYALPDDEGKILVSVDGIIQPPHEYTILSADFNEGSGASNQVVDLGSYAGHNNNPAKVEIRDISRLIGNDDSVILADADISRITWESTSDGQTTFQYGVTGSVVFENAGVAGAWTNTAFMGWGKDRVMVLVNGIIQDKDSYTLTGDTLTLGGGSGTDSPQSGEGDVFVDLIFFDACPAQHAMQYVQTGNAATGDGNRQTFRLYDDSNNEVGNELHPDSDSTVIVHVDGVYQHDNSYMIVGNKLSFFDEIPAHGANINVHVLKCTTVTPTNRRRWQDVGDGTTTQFTLPFQSTTAPYDDDGVMVFIDGEVIQEKDYSLNGYTLTFSTAPAFQAFIEVMGIFDITDYDGTSLETNLETRKKTIVCDGTQQIFDLSDFVFEKHTFGNIQDTYNEQKLLVYRNGEILDHTKYMIIGSKLYLTAIPTQGTYLEIVRFI